MEASVSNGDKERADNHEGNGVTEDTATMVQDVKKKKNKRGKTKASGINKKATGFEGQLDGPFSHSIRILQLLSH